MPRLTPDQEHQLYLSDPAAWRRYAAPSLCSALARAPESDVATWWGGLSREAQCQFWDLFDEDTRQRIRAARKANQEHDVA